MANTFTYRTIVSVGSDVPRTFSKCNVVGTRINYMYAIHPLQIHIKIGTFPALTGKINKLDIDDLFFINQENNEAFPVQ